MGAGYPPQVYPSKDGLPLLCIQYVIYVYMWGFFLIDSDNSNLAIHKLNNLDIHLRLVYMYIELYRCESLFISRFNEESL